MATYSDKDVVNYWLRLHNRLTGGTYQVESWPDDDTSKKNVDALCRDTAGRTLAVEHTLIEPYARHKADTDRFLKTLAVLGNLCTGRGLTTKMTQAVFDKVRAKRALEKAVCALDISFFRGHFPSPDTLRPLRKHPFTVLVEVDQGEAGA